MLVRRYPENIDQNGCGWVIAEHILLKHLVPSLLGISKSNPIHHKFTRIARIVQASSQKSSKHTPYEANPSATPFDSTLDNTICALGSCSEGNVHRILVHTALLLFVNASCASTNAAPPLSTISVRGCATQGRGSGSIRTFVDRGGVSQLSSQLAAFRGAFPHVGLRVKLVMIEVNERLMDGRGGFGLDDEDLLCDFPDMVCSI